MKSLLFFVIILFIGFELISQENKEIITLDVDKDCKSFISKRTIENEIYTKEFTLFKNITTNIKIVLALKDNQAFRSKGRVIYFLLDESTFRAFNMRDLKLDIDSTEHRLSTIIDFNHSLNPKSMKSEYQYAFGFEFSNELEQALINANSFDLILERSNSTISKRLTVNKSDLNNFKQLLSCFFQYASPIEQAIMADLKSKDEEYQRNLRSFPTNFRESTWLDSKEKVINSNNEEPIIEEVNSIGYSVKLNNDSFNAYYFFVNDKLYRGVYIFKENFTNENNYYRKYNELRDILSSKYGEPKFVKKNRSRDLWNNTSEIGLAIQTGEYEEHTVWETKNTSIILSIEGENFESKINIDYITKNEQLLDEAQQKLEKKKTEGF